VRLGEKEKQLVYQLVALGHRQSQVVKRINEQFQPKKEFDYVQCAHYFKRFRSFSSERQIEYLPHNMQTSFALQEVRINDDIIDLQHLNVAIQNKEGNMVELLRVKATIKNRIAQELGQALSTSKGGIGNINILQMIQNKFEGVKSKMVNMDPNDRLDIFRSMKEIEDAKDNGKGKNLS